jgi:hypothetical protein
MRRIFGFLLVLLASGYDAVNAQSTRIHAPLRHGRANDVTFSQQVVRLLQEHCQECHREGGIGPFPLMVYNDALSHARAIKSAVISGRMPDGASVRLDTGCTKPDTFEGRRRLTRDEIDTIARWVDLGAPEGNPAELPPALTFADGLWKGGQPDVILPVTSAGFSVPPRLGRDIFRRFPIRTEFGSAVYLTGFEALAGSGDDHADHLSRVVHHVMLWVDADCNSVKLEAAFAASNPQVKGAGFEGMLNTIAKIPVGFWSPGSSGIQLPEGVGVKIPANACLIAEVHYATYHEHAVLDKTLVGLKILKIVNGPAPKERVHVEVSNEQFLVPAGQPHYAVNASTTITQDATLLSAQPHSHQLGTDFLTYAVLPNGDKACLMDVQWNFAHQETYNYRQPVRLPAGTQVFSTCWYDNTENNPNQFHQPPIGIPFGTASDKEMCVVNLGVVYDKLQ